MHKHLKMSWKSIHLFSHNDNILCNFQKLNILYRISCATNYIKYDNYLTYSYRYSMYVCVYVYTCVCVLQIKLTCFEHEILHNCTTFKLWCLEHMLKHYFDKLWWKSKVNDTFKLVIHNMGFFCQHLKCLVTANTANASYHESPVHSFQIDTFETYPS